MVNVHTIRKRFTPSNTKAHTGIHATHTFCVCVCDHFVCSLISYTHGIYGGACSIHSFLLSLSHAILFYACVEQTYLTFMATSSSHFFSLLSLKNIISAAYKRHVIPPSDCLTIFDLSDYLIWQRLYDVAKSIR